MNQEPDAYFLNAPPLIPLDDTPARRPSDVPPQRPKGILKNATPAVSYREIAPSSAVAPEALGERLEDVQMSDGQGTQLSDLVSFHLGGKRVLLYGVFLAWVSADL